MTEKERAQKVLFATGHRVISAVAFSLRRFPGFIVGMLFANISPRARSLAFRHSPFFSPSSRSSELCVCAARLSVSMGAPRTNVVAAAGVGLFHESIRAIALAITVRSHAAMFWCCAEPVVRKKRFLKPALANTSQS